MSDLSEPLPVAVFRVRAVSLGAAGRLVLSAWERHRADVLLQAADRDRSLTAAVLLRMAVAAELGIDPAAVEIDRTCPTCGEQHGRPRIAGDPIQVSVTHSGDQVAVALAAAALGIDIEQVNAVDVDATRRDSTRRDATRRDDPDDGPSTGSDRRRRDAFRSVDPHGGAGQGDR